MNPPAPPSRSKAMPPFRSFVAVELPFTLAPTVATVPTSSVHNASTSRDNTASLSAEEKREIEAFLPPCFVVECVQHAVPQRTITTTAKSDGDGGAKAHDAASNDESGSSRSSSVSSGSNGPGEGSSRGSDHSNSNSDDEHDREVVGASRNKKVNSQKTAEVRLLTRHRRDYCTDPIFSDWRSTNWDVDEAATEATKEELNDAHRFGGDVVGTQPYNTAGDYQGGSNFTNRSSNSSSAAAAAAAHAQSVKRRRQEVFPSIEPQVLVNGYYRNDLLLQVRRRRRVRRYRDPVTQAVLREEFIEDEEEKPDKVEHGGSSGNERSPKLVAEVVGVVSRELELARPADFTFSLFTPEQLRASPSLCGADFFPPAHFLGTKASFEVRYEPGKDANTSVVENYGPDGAATRLSSHAAVDGDDTSSNSGEGQAKKERRETEASAENADLHDTSAQFAFALLPTISVSPEETATMPTRSPAHDEFLRSLSSSLDGSRDDDPPEVRTIVRLLAARPAWIVQELTDAMLRSGLCPRTHRNKQVMNCFTYVIRSGPFNRLRLRLGYDPYANSSSAPYERVAVRLHRRSELGVRLRDVSRSPYIESVTRLLLERDRARRTAYKATPGHELRSTLLELQCCGVREGRLVLPYQLIDAADDDVIADLLRHVTVVETPMEQRLRSRRRGWLSEAAYTRAMTHFTESLTALLEQEVEPLLRKFKGEEEAADAGRRHPQQRGSGGAGGVPSLPQHGADGEDEDDDDDDGNASSLSAMSSATAGDLSSEDDDEGEDDR